jgi:hypothetical protein
MAAPSARFAPSLNTSTAYDVSAWSIRAMMQ